MVKTIRVNSGIEIVGFREFSRELKRLGDDGQWQKDLKAVNWVAAKDIVAAARRRATDGPARKAVNAGALRANKAVNNASVTLKNTGRTPYAFGAEFGAKQYRQFRSWRGNQFQGWDGGPGYFLHPAIREEGPKILDKYMDEIGKLCERAFPD